MLLNNTLHEVNISEHVLLFNSPSPTTVVEACWVVRLFKLPPVTARELKCVKWIETNLITDEF